MEIFDAFGLFHEKPWKNSAKPAGMNLLHVVVRKKVVLLALL
ncbi:hypothetical protein OOT55_09640 [Marinimicrobium sp. C6131]|nr:hypothetical protein [Marinimicrobium sp. C6131]UZJ42915.1 hypothetical protein OOT55_09640 [Marinimicrobium sp. C6131]